MAFNDVTPITNPPPLGVPIIGAGAVPPLVNFLPSTRISVNPFDTPQQYGGTPIEFQYPSGTAPTTFPPTTFPPQPVRVAENTAPIPNPTGNETSFTMNDTPANSFNSNFIDGGGATILAGDGLNTGISNLSDTGGLTDFGGSTDSTSPWITGTNGDAVTAGGLAGDFAAFGDSAVSDLAGAVGRIAGGAAGQQGGKFWDWGAATLGDLMTRGGLIVLGIVLIGGATIVMARKPIMQTVTAVRP